ncbi:hypothetical protein AVEN_180768-1, partial [Araneus ventricosus]
PTTNLELQIFQEIQQAHLSCGNIKLACVKAHAVNPGNEVAGNLTIGCCLFGYQIIIPAPRSFLNKELLDINLKKWQAQWGSGDTGRST